MYICMDVWMDVWTYVHTHRCCGSGEEEDGIQQFTSNQRVRQTVNKTDDANLQIRLFGILAELIGKVVGS